MKKFIFIVAIFASTVFAYNNVYAQNIYDCINEVMKATVRIKSDNYGSGTVFEETETHYNILTNAHVAGSLNKIVKVCFFEDGFHKKRVNGKVIKFYMSSSKRMDLAIVSIEKNDLGDYKPNIIKLADKDIKLKPSDRIISMGLPQAKWPMAWIGHIKGQNKHVLDFGPIPFPGQSGSAIFVLKEEEDKKVLRIAGVITWKTIEDALTTKGKLVGYGSAIHVSMAYDLIEGKFKNESQRSNRRSPWRRRWFGRQMEYKFSTDTKSFTLSKNIWLSFSQ